MYDFINLQYKMRKLTATQVLAMAPKYITVEEAKAIIAGKPRPTA